MPFLVTSPMAPPSFCRGTGSVQSVGRRTQDGMSSTRFDTLNPCAARTPSIGLARVRPTLEKLAFPGTTAVPLRNLAYPHRPLPWKAKGPTFDGTPKPLQNRRLTRRAFVQFSCPLTKPNPQLADRLLDLESFVEREEGRRRTWPLPLWSSGLARPPLRTLRGDAGTSTEPTRGPQSSASHGACSGTRPGA